MIKISREVNCPSISCRAAIRLLYFECIFDFCLSPARCTVRLSIFCCKSCSRLLRDYFHSNGWFLLWNAWTISLGWKALKSHYFVWDFNFISFLEGCHASKVQISLMSYCFSFIDARNMMVRIMIVIILHTRSSLVK